MYKSTDCNACQGKWVWVWRQMSILYEYFLVRNVTISLPVWRNECGCTLRYNHFPLHLRKKHIITLNVMNKSTDCNTCDKKWVWVSRQLSILCGFILVHNVTISLPVWQNECGCKLRYNYFSRHTCCFNSSFCPRDQILQSLNFFSQSVGCNPLPVNRKAFSPV